MVRVATTSGPHYDIVIAGGGMIGTSLAVALAPLGLDVAVVEPVPRGEPAQPSFDERSTALSRSSQRMFEAMGLWQEIVAGATPIRSIHVSEKGRYGFSHIDAAEQGVEALGYVVINRILGEVLNRALSRLASVRLCCPAGITAVQQSDDYVTVQLDSRQAEDRLSCRLLVAADGAKSAVREMLGIGASSRDYGQQAITGNLLPEIRPEYRAFERFTETGPLALLPIADDRAAFVWVLPTERARAVMEMSDVAFTEALQDSFGLRLGNLSKVGRRASYPLSLTRANSLTAPRAVLVGNAAHGLHPVAAQGFNLGLRDVAALCDCLLDLLQEAGNSGTELRADPGSPALLATYAGWRRSDHSKVVRFTDGLVRLFGDRRGPLMFMRSAGMLGFDLIPGVRSLFARHTMGLAGRLPRLSRGVPLR